MALLSRLQGGAKHEGENNKSVQGMRQIDQRYIADTVSPMTVVLKEPTSPPLCGVQVGHLWAFWF